MARARMRTSSKSKIIQDSEMYQKKESWQTKTIRCIQKILFFGYLLLCASQASTSRNEKQLGVFLRAPQGFNASSHELARAILSPTFFSRIEFLGSPLAHTAVYIKYLLEFQFTDVFACF